MKKHFIAGFFLLMMLITFCAAPCFADFGVQVTVKEPKVVLYEQKPVLINYAGNTPKYSVGHFLVHVVLTNTGDTDKTIRLGSCSSLEWSRSTFVLGIIYGECSDYSTVGDRVLKGHESIESDVILGLYEGVKPGELKFKLGRDLGYVGGMPAVDWSNEVSVTIEDGTDQQKEQWKKDTLGE